MVDKRIKVRKSNQLIEARFRVNLNEYRILLYCAAQIKPLVPTVSGKFYIYAKEFAEMFELSESNAYKQLRDGLEATWEREFFEWIPESPNGWRRRRFVITQEYMPAKGYGMIELHPDYVTHLSNLTENFTTWSIMHMSHLSSMHSVRLYEMLVQYRKIGYRKLSVSWFREVTFLEEAYVRWTDLRKHVIQPALDEITQTTDIEVTQFEPIKRGRVVTDFKITFRQKAQQSLDLDAPPVPDYERWEGQGYRTPGEWREAQALARKHGVKFENASEFLAFMTDLRRNSS